MGEAGGHRRQQGVSNGAIFLGCALFTAGMVGAAYASVPLYRIFCEVTGYNGTTQRVEQYADRVLDQAVRVSFDANISSGLNWDFKPARAVDLKIGETGQVEFTATNRSATATTGTAVFNVTPMEAAVYFNKVQCFCFTEQTLKPGETVAMPVVFYVDPEIATAEETKNIRNITLSYTFYPSQVPAKPVAGLKDGKAGGGQGTQSRL